MSDKKKSRRGGLQNKNATYMVDIYDLNNLGCGVGRLPDGDDPADENSAGLVVFVRGTVSGDRAKIEIIKRTSSYAVGRLVEIVKPSEIRTSEDFCTAPEACGGCVYRHVSYDYELGLKKERVERAFRQSGLCDVAVRDVLSTGKTKHYRNKGMYPVSQGKSGMTAGFFAAKSHKIIPCSECSLQPKAFGEIVKTVCELCDRNHISAYDEITRKGILRHIYLRAAGDGSTLLCLVVNAEQLPKKFKSELIDCMTRDFPQICGILININRENTNVVLGDRFVTLFGDAYIEDILCGKKLRISAGSFYQVNRDAAELLYNTAAEMANFSGDENLLDLYCGAGSIGICMSDKVKTITGIEIIPEAAECASLNAGLNNIPTECARFLCGDATNAHSLLASIESDGAPSPDAVILDPPRKGTTRELIEEIAERNISKVVYISCEPETLARDCAVFRELGYEIGEVQPVDLFPRTGHVETVVCLTRKEKE